MAVTARVSEVQLEAMRVSDCSWHPCQVSLSSSGSLVVQFESLNLEDVIVNAEELHARVRARSLPLEGDDCQHIEEGEHVLAASKSNLKPIFFDAVLQEVLRTRHSKRIICRCTFTIKWMDQDPDSENITVPSSLVMKLSRESVQSHPVVAAFLNSMEKTSVSDGDLTNLDEPYGEYDVDGVIGKHIEEIGNLADGATNELFEDIIVRVKPDSSKGDKEEVSVSHSKLPFNPNKGNPRRRSTRNKSNLKTEAEDCEHVITASLQKSAENISAKDELAENRSPLNPLAARAALASLVSKFPQTLDFSFYEEEKDIVNDTTRLTHSTQHNERTVNGDVEPRNLYKDLIREDIRSGKQMNFSAEKGEDTSAHIVVQALRSDKHSQCTEPNLFSKKRVSPHAMGLKHKDVLIKDETVEKNKKMKLFSAGQTHSRNEGESPDDENSTLNQKRSKSLKQQPSRSSPRLNLSPHTRSQARS